MAKSAIKEVNKLRKALEAGEKIGLEGDVRNLIREYRENKSIADKGGKVVDSHDFEVTLQIVSWDQYFNAIIRERSYNVVEEYTLQTSYGKFGGDAEPEPSNEDAVYERDFAVVKDLDNPSVDIKKQFIKQLEKYPEEILGENFQDSVEVACLHAMERFCDITNCVVVDLGEGHYVLAPTTRDDLILKLVNFTQGALVVYRPTMFTKFLVKP